jgi:hypothetical protein
MQKFRILIHGQNLLSDVNGPPERLGFYTNVYTEAFTAAAAEADALEIVRHDPSLAEILLNADDDPLILSVEEICEIESFEGHNIPRDAFFLYSPEAP